MPIINRGKHGVTERTFKEIAGIGAWAGFCLDAGAGFLIREIALAVF